ncbi:MAG: histidine kinase [Rhodobacteraceae bacterium]|nr:histidine kinase [Paracoccaceae bacterium]
MVFGTGLLSLIFIGLNAVNLVDEAALAKQERIAARQLEQAVRKIPAQQRSATVWDDAVRKTMERDKVWMNENLGGWMQEYFGHDENYVLDKENKPIFASAFGEVWSTEIYEARAQTIRPLVAEIREAILQASKKQEDIGSILSELEAWDIFDLKDQLAIVSVAPIVPDSENDIQNYATENLHVAVRYLDDELANEISTQIELEKAAFKDTDSPLMAARVPLTDRSGNVITWLSWTPDLPGTDLAHKLLPVLLLTASSIILLIIWVTFHLIKVSDKLQVSEATALSTIRMLEEARDEAKVADLAKVNFLSVVSHELRTPLTVILGYARLGAHLKQMPPAKKLAQALESDNVCLGDVKNVAEEIMDSSVSGMVKIEKSGEHLLFLVNQLLDYARIETGRLEVEPEVCDITYVVAPVVEQMRVLTEEKGLELNAELKSAMVYADVVRTRQIVVNLLGNAIKFTKKGGISLSIKEKVDVIEIVIQDSGIGIENKDIERVFKAFYQTDSSSSRTVEGVGLGLSIAKELANLEGGDITVSSEVGVGSTFTLTLRKA